MMPPVSVSSFPRRSRLRGRWLYVWFIACDYYFTRTAGCSLTGRLRSFSVVLQRKRGDYDLQETRDLVTHSGGPCDDDTSVELLSLPRTRSQSTHRASSSLATSSSGTDGTEERELACLSREEAQLCEAMYTQIRSLREWLPTTGTSPISDGEKLNLCSDTNVRGLDAVTHFFQFLQFNGGDYSLQLSLFPSSHPVLMTSVLTGRKAKYHCVEKAHVCTVQEAAGGQAYSVRIRRHKYEVTQTVVRRTMRKLKDYLTLHKTFGEASLHSVECTYRLLTVRDIVVHPGSDDTQACVASSGVLLLNYFLLYSPLKVNLLAFVKTLEAHKGSSPEEERLASVARLNLSLQVIQLVGNVRSKHILLPRMRLHHFRLSASGTLYFLSLKAPRKEPEDTTTDHESDRFMKGAGETSEHVRHVTNETDMCVVLIHIWCPSEATASSISVEDVNQEKLLKSIVYPQCHDMPTSLRDLVGDSLHSNMNAAKLLSSPMYKRVEELLQREVDNV